MHINNTQHQSVESNIDFKSIGTTLLNSAVNFGLNKLEEYLTKDNNKSCKRVMYVLVDNTIPYEIYKRDMYEEVYCGKSNSKDKSLLETIVDIFC